MVLGWAMYVCLSVYVERKKEDCEKGKNDLEKRKRETGSKSVPICICLGVFVCYCECSGAPGTE